MLTKARTLMLMLLLLLISGNLYGANVDAAKSIMDTFQQASNQWAGPLQQAATWLLLSLATISLVWKFGLLALQNADFQEFVVELFRLVLFVGFFLALIQNADVWSQTLIEGFAWLTNYASSGGMIKVGSVTPASILHRGMSLALTIYESATGWGSTILYGLLILPIVAMYALIAAFILLVFCEAYFVTVAGIILLGFGGNQWTNDYAIRYLTYCISVGMKLFVTLLVVGLGEQLVYDWAMNSSGDLASFDNVIAVIGVLVLLAVLVWMLPNIIQGVVNGSSLNSGAGSFGAVAAFGGGAAAGVGAAAAGAAQAASSGTMSVIEAAKLAHTQLETGSAGGKLGEAMSQSGKSLGFSAVAAQTAKNLGQGAATVAGDWARGNSGGGKVLPEVAKAIHAARVQAGADVALRAAGASPALGGSQAGSKASPDISPPADPIGRLSGRGENNGGRSPA